MAFIFKKNKEKKVKTPTKTKKEQDQSKSQPVVNNISTGGTLLDLINKK
jgi:hypothetical protein